MYDKDHYTATLTLIQYVKPLLLLNKCKYEDEISKQKKLSILHPKVPVPFTQAAGTYVANQRGGCIRLSHVP